MRRLKVVVAGGGLISQVEHIPNLLFLKDRFEVLAVADPSASTRDHIRSQFGVDTVETVDALWALAPDAVVIGAPDSYHPGIATEALSRGLHVFCEKPLAVSVEMIDALITSRDAACRVLQVGFMKRWDPAYEMLIEEVRGRGDQLRYIAVECNDPDSWPFVAHHAFHRGEDVPAAVRLENRRQLQEQTAAAFGSPLEQDDIYAYVDSFSSSMIHDLNAVNGLLRAMGIERRKPTSASIFARGRGTSATMALNGDQARCHFAHVVVPKLAEYNERISLFFDDCRFELVFPSPYLHNFQTALTRYRSDGHRLEKTSLSNGYGESFVRELQGFHDSVVDGAPVRNTPEEARDDMVLVREFMTLALKERQQLGGADVDAR